MSELLQQAISLIESSKNQDAQQLLDELLKSDPNNDQVWLCMSTLVPVERRQYYIEKAISLNPENLQARQALNSLPQQSPTVRPPAPRCAADFSFMPAQQPVAVTIASLSTNTSPVRPATPRSACDLPASSAQPPVVPLSAPAVFAQDKPAVWMNQRKSFFYMTILTGNELITGKLNPGLVKQANAQLQQGKLPVELLKAIKHIPLEHITEVKQHLSILSVRYTQENTPASTDLRCKNEPMAEDMLRALENRLGVAFERSDIPTTKAAILGISCFGSAILLAIISFCYYAAQDLVTNNVRPIGSAHIRGITRLLELLGPNGIMFLGVIIMLVVVFVTVSTLAKPPMITKLLLKARQTKTFKK
jgi:hypothetical protein